MFAAPLGNRALPLVVRRHGSSTQGHCCPVELSAKRRSSFVCLLEFIIDGDRDANYRLATACRFVACLALPTVMAAEAAIHDDSPSTWTVGFLRR
jgi:hypothetical protein